jgi:homoserine kinase
MAVEGMKHVSVRVPATTANLGPGFDCLGLALDLWNETTISLTGNQRVVSVNGEGAGELPQNEDNLLLKSIIRVYGHAGMKPPNSLLIDCRNSIPLKSGLGSSAAAVLTGLLAGSALLGDDLGDDALLDLGMEIEGHPDNLAAALYGGLVIVSQSDDKVVKHRVSVPELKVIVLLPEIDLSTRAAREILPNEIPLQDAIFNASRIPLVIEALSKGDLDLLAHAMQDRLHQPYRLPIIPGAEEALRAAHDFGVPASLSGAGPSLIAFVHDGQEDAVLTAMKKGFDQAGVSTREFRLSASPNGAQVIPPKIP